MSPRTYRASTMAEALAKVKQDLGRRAMIMRTRTVKSGGFLGVGVHTLVEITASTNTNVLPAPPRADTMTRRSAETATRKAPTVSPPPPDTPESAAVRSELHDIKSLVQGLVKQSRKDQIGTLPAELRQAYIKLIQNHVAEELATMMIHKISACCRDGKTMRSGDVQELLVQQIAQLLKPGCPITLNGAGDGKVVALVGPTGVGKTTTIAKLAAHFRLKEHKKVGLVTVDTYRIAAVEQLKTYAKIIDIPLEVALTPDELRSAVRRLKDCDIVLIDTAGRSQLDELKLNELKQFLQASQPDEVHLVLSCNTSEAVLSNAIDRFSKLGINRVIMTKLDESIGMGTLLSVMQCVDAQLSYVTTGQDVPDDIRASDGRSLASLILGDRSWLN